ncbi:hypothetical protein CYMTET_31080 [Cymbomonas tetramitiformis]|uniref:CCZ1/INTU/HSP4 first Longin domain-containing protein n=1 Tax=Cymbomonas tetramitiformis TaxID=36881 RepID=A0AAE0FI77_9CHLO|nr:hypothetical protein CYMTET_31080 [Cymbomonas tetramitiformis]
MRLTTAVPSVPSVLFLDRNAEEDSDSLLYVFPRNPADVEQGNKLKGLMLALRGLLDALAGQMVTHAVLHQLDSEAGGHIKGVFVHFKGTLVVVMLPAHLSDFIAEHVSAHVINMAIFLQGNPDDWMERLVSSDSKQQRELDSIFDAAFGQIFGGEWRTMQYLTTLPMVVS